MAQKLFCTRCYRVDTPKTETKGWFLIELVLWLVFLVPGLCYSIWRLTSRQKVCRACGSPELVPTDSQRALTHGAGAPSPAGVRRVP